MVGGNAAGVRASCVDTLRCLCLAIGIAFLGLSLSGCAFLPGAIPTGTAFGSTAPGEPIHERPVAEAAADAAEPATVDDRLKQGDAFRKAGAYAEAMWAYIQAHELDLSRPEPIARMGSLHLMVDPRRAESIFRDLVATYPASAAAHTGLGLTLIERDDWTGARDVLARSIEIDPRSPAAHSALGVALDSLGEHSAARAAYARATALEPAYYEALNNLGVSYLTTGEFSAAEIVLKKAAEQQNRDPAVFNNLGVALGRLGRYDDALQAFLRAGSEQAARNNLGYVSYLNGDYERAISEYELALLATGDQRLGVLRNLRAAQRAQEALQVSAED